MSSRLYRAGESGLGASLRAVEIKWPAFSKPSHHTNKPAHRARFPFGKPCTMPTGPSARPREPIHPSARAWERPPRRTRRDDTSARCKPPCRRPPAVSEERPRPPRLCFQKPGSAMEEATLPLGSCCPACRRNIVAQQEPGRVTWARFSYRQSKLPRPAQNAGSHPACVCALGKGRSPPWVSEPLWRAGCAEHGRSTVCLPSEGRD